MHRAYYIFLVIFTFTVSAKSVDSKRSTWAKRLQKEWNYLEGKANKPTIYHTKKTINIAKRSRTNGEILDLNEIFDNASDSISTSVAAPLRDKMRDKNQSIKNFQLKKRSR